MRLRRWCVSIVSEQLKMFWTLRAAERDYWANWEFTDRRDRMGLYRWSRGKWIRQQWVINGHNGGQTKVWIDEST